jgi:hypothetical protein
MLAHRKSLVDHLKRRGLVPAWVPGLLRTVREFRSQRAVLTPTLVNRKLARLGWGSELLDHAGFYLLLAVLEEERSVPGVLSRRPHQVAEGAGTLRKGGRFPIMLSH